MSSDNNNISVQICSNPLDSNDKKTFFVKKGMTIDQYFSLFSKIIPPQLKVIATFNDNTIPKNKWNSQRLNDNDRLSFTTIPQKEAVSTAITIFAIAASGPIGLGLGTSIFGAGSFGAAATASLFTSSLYGVINSTTWSNVSPSTALGLEERSPTYSLYSQANRVRTGQPIPVIYGRHKIIPDLIAPPYTRFENNGKQTIYQLFAVGHGYFSLTKAMIGDNTLNKKEHDFSASNLKDPDSSLPSAQGNWHVINSNIKSFHIKQEDAWSDSISVGRNGVNVSTIEVDIILPNGLYGRSGTSFVSENIDFDIEFRAFGKSDWIPIKGKFSFSGGSNDKTNSPSLTSHSNGFRISAKSKQTISYSIYWQVVSNKYEVRIKRASAPSSNSDSYAVCTGIKGYMSNPPSSYPDISTLPLRLEANASSSDRASQEISLIVYRKIKTLNSELEWSKPTTTRRIPFILADMLTNKTYGAALNDEQIDLESLYKLHSSLPSHHYFGGVFDQSTTLWEALQKTARCARTDIYIQGGKVRFSRDQDNNVPCTLFGAHNIIKDSFSISYRLDSDDTPSEVTIEYTDEKNNWTPNTVTSSLEHKFPQQHALNLQLFGCLNKTHAKDEADFILNCSRKRRRIVKFDTELDGLLPVFGDTIAISHPLPSWGVSGHITSYDDAKRRLFLSESVKKGGYIAIRNEKGEVIGPFRVKLNQNANDKNQVDVEDEDLDLSSIKANLSSDNSYLFAFGTKDSNWSSKARVIAIRPKNQHLISIEAVVED